MAKESTPKSHENSTGRLQEAMKPLQEEASLCLQPAPTDNHDVLDIFQQFGLVSLRIIIILPHRPPNSTYPRGQTHRPPLQTALLSTHWSPWKHGEPVGILATR